MSKYEKSDDGKVVGGATLVWLERPVSAGPSRSPAALARAAASQAAALEAAADGGVPFCQRCDPAEASAGKPGA